MSRRARIPVVCAVLAVALVAALVPLGYAAPVAGEGDDATRRWTGSQQTLGHSKDPFVQGEVLVKFRSGVAGTAAATSAHRAVGATRLKGFDAVDGLELVRLKPGAEVEKAVAAYEAMPAVEYAQPNYRIKLSATTPDDALFPQLWGLDNTGQTVGPNPGTPDADIDAPDAWDVTTGSADVLIAVIDTGIDYSHPDLVGNVWTNAGEIPGNDTDDDGNGWVDDVYGADTVNEDADPMDDYGHGTHCAGTIGGVGDNGIGVAGVNWDVSVMGVKTFDAGGWGTTEDILEGFAYALDAGATVLSCSWGGYDEDLAIYDAIAAAPDALFVVAAGNDSSDIDGEYPAYPAAFDLENILTVGATDPNDLPAWFTNYGATSVDVFAPGETILSTVPGIRSLLFDDDLTFDTLYADDLSDMDDWVSSDPSAPWELTAEHFVSAPTGMARLGYGNDEASYVDGTVPIDLSTATAPYLVFELGGIMEMYADVAVVGVYDVSEDRYTALNTFWELGTSGFQTQYVDLKACIGQDDLYLWFGLQSDASISADDGYEGVWVDDVRVIDIGTSLGSLFADDFAGLTAWNTTQYINSQWVHDPTIGSTAPGSAAIASYAPNEWSVMLLDTPIDLSQMGATLSFDALYDIESYYDTVIVAATSDGGQNWWYLDQLTGISGGGSTMTWEHRSVSLAEFTGAESVQIAFHLMSDGMERDRGATRGAWIDDVSIDQSPWVMSEPDYENAYQYADGTSMATPHVSGIVGLLLAEQPGASVAELKAAVMDTVDQHESLEGLCVTGGRVNAASALVALGNQPPIAVDDEYITEQDLELVVAAPGVLGNDTDAEDGTLTAAVVVEPEFGALALNEDGSFTYTPGEGFSGDDGFVYRVSDGIEPSADANVMITVMPKSTLEDSAVGVTFDRFVPSTSVAYSGGTYVYGRWTGTRLDARFTGSAIRWIGPKQPGYGKADVYIDNVKIATVDCYAPEADKTLSAVLFESEPLEDGRHTISIRLTGAKNVLSSGYVVVVDRFEAISEDAVGGAVRTDDAAADFAGPWIRGFSTTYVGGGYSYSRWRTASVRHTFNGTRVAWIGPRMNTYGRAEVWIDGIYRATVSQFGPTGWRCRVWESPTLAPGVHTIEVRPTGLKDAASLYPNVVVDAFDVTP